MYNNEGDCFTTYPTRRQLENQYHVVTFDKEQLAIVIMLCFVLMSELTAT